MFNSSVIAVELCEQRITVFRFFYGSPKNTNCSFKIRLQRSVLNNFSTALLDRTAVLGGP